MLTLFIAGVPAAVAVTQQAKAQAEVALAQAAELAKPLAAHDAAIAQVLAALATELPPLETPEAVELEALRRLTTLQSAIESFHATPEQLSAADAAEALRTLPARGTNAEDVQAIREALRRGDFEQASEQLQALADATSEMSPSGDRKEAMDALARDLEAAAKRAEAMEAARAEGKADGEAGGEAEGEAGGEANESASSASKAIEAMAEDVRQCSNGTCDKPSQACDTMSRSAAAAKDAKQASKACENAAGACAAGSQRGEGSGATPSGGGGQSPLGQGDNATTPINVQPNAPGDETASVVDIESAPGGRRVLDSVPVGPVPIGAVRDASTRQLPTPEALRRLPARYQDAVRRFFGTGSATTPSPSPTQPSEGS
jgi:hypothetical protein